MGERPLVRRLVPADLGRSVRDASGATVGPGELAWVDERTRTASEWAEPSDEPATDNYCPDCDRTFKNAAGLAIHRRSMHEG